MFRAFLTGIGYRGDAGNGAPLNFLDARAGEVAEGGVIEAAAAAMIAEHHGNQWGFIGGVEDCFPNHRGRSDPSALIDFLPKLGGFMARKQSVEVRPLHCDVGGVGIKAPFLRFHITLPQR